MRVSHLDQFVSKTAWIAVWIQGVAAADTSLYPTPLFPPIDGARGSPVDDQNQQLLTSSIEVPPDQAPPDRRASAFYKPSVRNAHGQQLKGWCTDWGLNSDRNSGFGSVIPAHDLQEQWRRRMRQHLGISEEQISATWQVAEVFDESEDCEPIKHAQKRGEEHATRSQGYGEDRVDESRSPPAETGEERVEEEARGQVYSSVRMKGASKSADDIDALEERSSRDDYDGAWSWPHAKHQRRNS